MQRHIPLPKLALAAATVALLSGTASFAMDSQFTELDKIIRTDLAGLGITSPDLSKLSYEQINQISTILSEPSKGMEKQKTEVEQILNAGTAHTMQMKSVTEVPGGTELERIVVGDLKAMGVDVKNPEKLTLAQLEQLSDILNRADTKGSAGTRQEIEAVLDM